MTHVDRSTVLSALRELADRAYQERVWSGSDPRLLSSSTEAAERLYDDSGLEHALDRGSVFGPEIDERFRRLVDCLDTIEETQPIEDLLRDESLVRSRALAAEILGDLARNGLATDD